MNQFTRAISFVAFVLLGINCAYCFGQAWTITIPGPGCSLAYTGRYGSPVSVACPKQKSVCYRKVGNELEFNVKEQNLHTNKFACWKGTTSHSADITVWSNQVTTWLNITNNFNGLSPVIFYETGLQVCGAEDKVTTYIPMNRKRCAP
jgi:hypothetical protein